MPTDPPPSHRLLSHPSRGRSGAAVRGDGGQAEGGGSLLKRGWLYQGERFPLVKHGLLIAIFSGAAVGYGASLSGTVPRPSAALVAGLSTLGFFWQMRVADEFKDFADDAQYRPYRPVPRGLVTLRELALAGLISAALQVLLALWMDPRLLGLLGGVWAYFGLMCREFFVRDWLKAHPVVYVLSHMVLVPLIGAYAIATQTLPTAGTVLPEGGLPFLLACFCNGLVIELGRKIRLPAAEEPGVQTYSALWGLPMAVRLWLGAVGATALLTLGAAGSINALGIGVPILAPLLGWIGFKVWPFLGRRAWSSDCLALASESLRPEALPPEGHEGEGRHQDVLDRLTAMWTLGVYLSLGWLPWLLGNPILKP